MTTDIANLQRRLGAALERIGSGVEQLERPRPTGPAIDPDAHARLQEDLRAERETNAQMEERLRAQRDKIDRMEREHQQALAEAERGHREALDRMRQELADAEIQAQRIRRTNTQLRNSIQALREATEAGVAEPHLINDAIMSELESLRVAREGDRAELDAILGELKPMLEEGHHA